MDKDYIKQLEKIKHFGDWHTRLLNKQLRRELKKRKNDLR